MRVSQRKQSSCCYSSKPRESNAVLSWNPLGFSLYPFPSNFKLSTSSLPYPHTHTPANLILQSTLNFSLFPSLSHAKSSIKWPMVQLCFQLPSISGRSGVLQSMEMQRVRQQWISLCFKNINDWATNMHLQLSTRYFPFAHLANQVLSSR